MARIASVQQRQKIGTIVVLSEGFGPLAKLIGIDPPLLV